MISVDRETKTARGSARSVKGFNLFEALTAVSDLLLEYGGHEYAAGLEVSVENLEPFRKRITSYVQEKMKEETFVKKFSIDAEITLSDINKELLHVSGSIGIRATLTDNTALGGAALLIDGVMIESQAVAGVRATVDFIWDAEDAAAGAHELGIRVTDEDGNQSTASITLHKL